MVVLPTEPEIAPGFIVHVPDGNPFRTTLPVETAQVGWVLVPITGAEGVIGCVFITTLADGADRHPAAVVMVKLYVPLTSPEIILLAPDPDIAPGFIVQFPDGKPFNVTLPVATEHAG